MYLHREMLWKQLKELKHLITAPIAFSSSRNATFNSYLYIEMYEFSQ